MMSRKRSLLWTRTATDSRDTAKQDAPDSNQAAYSKRGKFSLVRDNTATTQPSNHQAPPIPPHNVSSPTRIASRLPSPQTAPGTSSSICSQPASQPVTRPASWHSHAHPPPKRPRTTYIRNASTPSSQPMSNPYPSTHPTPAPSVSQPTTLLSPPAASHKPHSAKPSAQCTTSQRPAPLPPASTQPLLNCKPDTPHQASISTTRSLPQPHLPHVPLTTSGRPSLQFQSHHPRPSQPHSHTTIFPLLPPPQTAHTNSTLNTLQAAQSISTRLPPAQKFAAPPTRPTGVASPRKTPPATLAPFISNSSNAPPSPSASHPLSLSSNPPAKLFPNPHAATASLLPSAKPPSAAALNPHHKPQLGYSRSRLQRPRVQAPLKQAAAATKLVTRTLKGSHNCTILYRSNRYSLKRYGVKSAAGRASLTWVNSGAEQPLRDKISQAIAKAAAMAAFQRQARAKKAAVFCSPPLTYPPSASSPSTHTAPSSSTLPGRSPQGSTATRHFSSASHSSRQVSTSLVRIGGAMYYVIRKGGSRKLLSADAQAKEVARQTGSHQAQQRASGSGAAGPGAGRKAAAERRRGSNKWVRSSTVVVRVPSVAKPSALRRVADSAVQRSLKAVRARQRAKQASKTRGLCPHYCRRGACQLAQAGHCRHVHDPEMVAVCTRWLAGSCTKPNCKLQHKVKPELMPTCLFFLEGLCSNANCPYLHVNVSPEAPVCSAFLSGHCPLGASCCRKHFSARMIKDIKQGTSRLQRYNKVSSAWANGQQHGTGSSGSRRQAAGGPVVEGSNSSGAAATQSTAPVDNEPQGEQAEDAPAGDGWEEIEFIM